MFTYIYFSKEKHVYDIIHVKILFNNIRGLLAMDQYGNSAPIGHEDMKTI